MSKKIQLILRILIVGIVLGGVGYIYRDIFTRGDTSDTSNTGGNIGDTKENTIHLGVEPPSEKRVTAPSLDRKIVFDNSVSKEAQAIIKANIERITRELKADSNLFQSWIDLGLYRKVIGDYDGAREAWEYAGAIRPSSGLPFRNLGDLYGYYIKDAQKAEENLLKAIEKSPDQIEFYLKTSDFYREVVKDMEKSRNILKQGIKANPNSANLQNLLNSQSL